MIEHWQFEKQKKRYRDDVINKKIGDKVTFKNCEQD